MSITRLSFQGLSLIGTLTVSNSSGLGAVCWPEQAIHSEAGLR